eukprot:gene8509-10829_t
MADSSVETARLSSELSDSHRIEIQTITERFTSELHTETMRADFATAELSEIRSQIEIFTRQLQEATDLSSHLMVDLEAAMTKIAALESKLTKSQCIACVEMAKNNTLTPSSRDLSIADLNAASERFTAQHSELTSRADSVSQALSEAESRIMGNSVTVVKKEESVQSSEVREESHHETSQTVSESETVESSSHKSTSSVTSHVFSSVTTSSKKHSSKTLESAQSSHFEDATGSFEMTALRRLQ